MQDGMNCLGWTPDADRVTKWIVESAFRRRFQATISWSIPAPHFSPGESNFPMQPASEKCSAYSIYNLPLCRSKKSFLREVKKLLKRKKLTMVNDCTGGYATCAWGVAKRAEQFVLHWFFCSTFCIKTKSGIDFSTKEVSLWVDENFKPCGGGLWFPLIRGMNKNIEFLVPHCWSGEQQQLWF